MERQYLAALAQQAVMRLTATMPTHLLPATVVTAQALVRSSEFTQIALTKYSLRCNWLQALFNNQYISQRNFVLQHSSPWCCDGKKRMAKRLVAKVGCSVLQHMDRFWVLAWALVAMGTVVALGDQWWSSALMGAAASSLYLLSLQPSLSLVK